MKRTHPKVCLDRCEICMLYGPTLISPPFKYILVIYQTYSIYKVYTGRIVKNGAYFKMNSVSYYISSFAGAVYELIRKGLSVSDR